MLDILMLRNCDPAELTYVFLFSGHMHLPHCNTAYAPQYMSCLKCRAWFQELMLLKQSQVLTNLASLDEEEAARAESAGLRWQVSPFASLTRSHMHTRLSLCTPQPLLPCFYLLQLYLKLSCFESVAFCCSGICCAHAVLMLCLCCAVLMLCLGQF